MNELNDIIVSVCMVTYRHEQFVSEAIESIVSQKTNFRFELVIGEDCGMDATREICIRYQQKYPDIIRLNFPKTNVGAQQNFMNTYRLCQGKYVALCEGDDYWTDPYKLQKQVDFLENNPSYVMCAHAAKMLLGTEFTDCTISKDKLNIKDILTEDWGIMTASILFKKEAFVIPDWFTQIRNGDMGLQLLLSLKGDIAYLNDSMCVYRKHPGGISATLRPLNQAAWLSYLLYEFNKYTKGKYLQLIKRRIGRMYDRQIFFANEYHLRKAKVTLISFNCLRPILPFVIRHLRK